MLSISRARNLALELGQANLIAFIDDDEVPNAAWLVNLVRTLHQTDASAVFGPVLPAFADGTPSWVLRGGFYDRSCAAAPEEIPWKQARPGNTLVVGEWFYGPQQMRFDEDFGRTGAEDTELFMRIEAAGGRLVSAPNATVTEDIPANKCRLRCLWQRAYRGGFNRHRIVSLQGRGLHPILRFSARCARTLTKVGLSIPACLRRRPEGLLQAVMDFALALGAMHAWIMPCDHSRRSGYASGDLS